MNIISHKVDLLVADCGVAGTVAAIAAARRGLKTVLVQNRPVLGGPVRTEKLRLEITATNGDQCARVYEFRAREA